MSIYKFPEGWLLQLSEQFEIKKWWLFAQGNVGVKSGSHYRDSAHLRGRMCTETGMQMRPDKTDKTHLDISNVDPYMEW